MKYEPVSQNPQPEPGVDITRSYEWRFRDPAFVVIWDRWQWARANWRKVWERVPFSDGGPDSLHDPDPNKIDDPAHRIAAKEFRDAREAYRTEITRRDQP